MSRELVIGKVLIQEDFAFGGRYKVDDFGERKLLCEQCIRIALGQPVDCDCKTRKF